MKTFIYAIYLIALIGATSLFVLTTLIRWKVREGIKEKIVLCLFSRKDKEEINRHESALTECTFDAVSWTAISIGGIYACFDCLVSLINTL